VENPLLRPVKYSLENYEEEELLLKDNDDAAIVNSVGDQFDVPPTQEEVYLVLVASANYANLQTVINTANTYHGTVNRTSFYRSPAKTVRFLPITSGELQYENGFTFYTVSYRFAFKASGWTPREFLNQGWRFRENAGEDPKPAIDPVTRQMVLNPVKLALDGTMLPEGQDPVFVSFETRAQKDFNDLGV
jgi:hypothetical protein